MLLKIANLMCKFDGRKSDDNETKVNFCYVDSTYDKKGPKKFVNS
jgi:hypothetical protein